MRLISEGRFVHESSDESGNLTTYCGRRVKGDWRLVDGDPVNCPGCLAERDDWPRHQPIAPDAPIPGRQWYGGCDPDGGYVSPEGICSSCHEKACPRCGAGFYPDGRCQCPAYVVEKEHHRARVVKGWAFMALSDAEVAAVRAFLADGNTAHLPPRWQGLDYPLYERRY